MAWLNDRSEIVKWRSQCIKKSALIFIIDDLCDLIAEFATHSKYNEYMYTKRIIQSDLNIPINLVDIKHNIKRKVGLDGDAVYIIENMKEFSIRSNKQGIYTIIIKSISKHVRPNTIRFDIERCNNIYDNRFILNVSHINSLINIAIS